MPAKVIAALLAIFGLATLALCGVGLPGNLEILVAPTGIGALLIGGAVWMMPSVANQPSIARRCADSVRFNDQAVSLASKSESTQFAWSDVRAIDVYKRDLFAVDSICIAFLLTDGRWVGACEEDDGFKALCQHLPERFAGIPEDWFTKVMQPPFAENRRTIWSRDSVSTDG